MNITELQETIQTRLRKIHLSERQASLQAVGRGDLIQDIKRGRMPSFDRVLKLFKVLGIEFSFRVHPLTDETSGTNHRVMEQVDNWPMTNETDQSRPLTPRQLAFLDNLAHCSEADREALFRMVSLAASDGKQQEKISLNNKPQRQLINKHIKIKHKG